MFSAKVVYKNKTLPRIPNLYFSSNCYRVATQQQLMGNASLITKMLEKTTYVISGRVTMSKLNFFALSPTGHVRSITVEQHSCTHPVLLQTRRSIPPAHVRLTYKDAVAAFTFTEIIDFAKTSPRRNYFWKLKHLDSTIHEIGIPLF
jgi:hypothetical protein